MDFYVHVRKGSYYDSVTLMIITKEIKKMSGIKEVIVGMGTDLNKELAANLGFTDVQIGNLTPNDFFIAITSDEEKVFDTVINKVDELLNSKKDESASEFKVRTISSAVKHLKGANMAVISLPGQYAAYEARQALLKGLHVMLFSDNVTIDEELELKKLAKEKGLLVMGPDCGTAIINQIPLCFANVVRKGDIGIVGASGTGTQEVCVVIDRLGGGVSQVIGTGGRDLKSQIGGIMMLEGFKALIDDPETKVIVLVSKPPAPEIADNILSMVQGTNKPVVVHFIGGDRAQVKKNGAYDCASLEDAAYKAVCISRGETVVDFNGFTQPEEEIDQIVKTEASKLHSTQKYLRALYTGGTLADEAMKLLGKEGFEIYSNIPLAPQLRLENINKSRGHTCIDLGDDDFTRGKPHPMIDPSGRAERLLKEAEHDDTAIILLDFVLGYGSNADPAGEMLPAVIKAKSEMERRQRYLCVVGTICGSAKDPQNYEAQKAKLEEAGVIIMPSNAQAVRLVKRLLDEIEKRNH